MHARTMLALLVIATAAFAAAGEPPDAAAGPRLYVVSTAHLDTQWRWTIQDTIDDLLPATLRDNFALFERYPGYVFSFEGAFRYALAKEYYPAEYERLKQLVRDGRWKVAGSWVDAVDTNIPSPESLIRHALYGNGFFRRELGVTSRDVFLPDCFGFGYALPSVAAHSGLLAFSTQKLTWGSSIKIPFDVGFWQGVDGTGLVATLNPSDYASEIKGNLTLDPDVYAILDRQAALSGLPVGVRYFGTGDVGIAPIETSIAELEKSLHGPGPLAVVNVAPDQLARDLMARGEVGRLPRYRGEFLLTSHGAGCYTSQAAMKSYNRANQRLADAAERVAVAADWLGGLEYPRETLREAWTRFLWHQFHDDLTGTSIPEAYTFSWNDEAIAANTFADVLTAGVGAVSRALDTRVEGVPLVVSNPLSIEREDVVEARVHFPGGAPRAVRVVGPDGRELAAQIGAISGDEATVVLVARLAPVSVSVLDVRPAAAAPRSRSELSVSPRGLENARLRVRLDAAGNVASVFDKALGRELLSAPLRLELFEDEPRKWAAWEVEYAALSKPPREVVGGPARVRVVESGPARVALEVVREAAGSTFTQRLSLAAGAAGDRLEIVTDVDWRSKATLLKAAFPLAAVNRNATYDLGLGVVERGSNRPNLYEVPAQQWADITDASGAFGVAVLNDSRHGWDKPDERTLRLTLVHTPRVVPSWKWLDDQNSNDLGHHRVVMALAGHAGDWRSGVVAAGDRLNQPLLAWQVPAHEGALGRGLSMLRVSPGADGAPAVAVRALKLAEESDEVIVRLFETTGRTQERVTLAFAADVVAVRELNGAEEPLEEHGDGGALPDQTRPPLALADGRVVLGFAPFRPRTIAVRLAPAPVQVPRTAAVPLTLAFDRDGISRDDDRCDGDFDGAGRTIAGELLPARLMSAGIPFLTGPQGAGEANVLLARGQTLALPEGDFNRLDLLAASVGGDRLARFGAGEKAIDVLVPDWEEPVGQWSSRLVGNTFQEEPDRIAPGYAKQVPLGWVGSHRHGAKGENEAYVFTNLFRVALDLPAGARTVTLPDDERIIVIGATAVRDDARARPAQVFVEPGRATLVHVTAPRLFLDRATVRLTSPSAGATVRYTLDGSEPTASSPAYAGPIALDRSATVKARAFAPGLDDRFVATAEVTKAAPRPAAGVDRGGLAPGLACRLYTGEWRKMPDFTALEHERTLTVPTVALPADRPAVNFGLVCSGYLQVPADAVYTVALRAEDGAELLVGGEKVLTEDWIDYTRRSTTLALAAGLHPIEVRYFQRSFVAGLELLMDAPDAPMAPVEAGRLYH